MRAHEIFLARGGTPGLELDDWLKAERELKAAASQRAEPHPVGTGETGPGQA